MFSLSYNLFNNFLKYSGSSASNSIYSFVLGCIKPESPITEVTIKNTEITKEYMEESFSRLDVFATTQDGELINIEMQRADEKNMVKRSLYYWDRKSVV